jgi:pyruvate formate lyase activating enzyme
MQMNKKEAGSDAGHKNASTAVIRQAPTVAEEACGWVFNIQQFSIEDGPGLRTTMFLKGCPLRCPWCSNPESIYPLPQVKFTSTLCRGCGTCVSACPKSCLILDEDNKIVFDAGLCSHCMECLAVCPSDCITGLGVQVTKENAVRILLKDKAFYDNTGGGVTISGGEPLFQHKFTAGVLKELKAQGVHTAIDTTGYAPLKAMRAVIKHTDLVLFDIKHLDPARHKEVIGVSNDIILRNLRACKGMSEFWLRTPLIPGFNDDPEHMDAIVALGREVGATRCYFLPFHRWGEHKYARLGLPKTYQNIREFTSEEIDVLRERFHSLYGYVFFEKA